MPETARGDVAYVGSNPEGSFPINDCEDLKKAREAYGRAPVSERATLRRFIIKRHRELSCPEALPESWYR